MAKLVNTDGGIDFGICGTVVDSINYLDYHLEKPMGGTVSRLMKRLLFKQFNFIGILGPEIMVGLAVVDMKYLTSGFFYIHDRAGKRLIETKSIAPFFSGHITPDPSKIDASYSFRGLSIRIQDNTVTAKGKDMDLRVELDLPHANPLRICTRAGYRGWAYTEKTAPVSVRGRIQCKGKTWDVSSPDTMALIDWSAGFMRRQTCWNWAAAAATLPDGRTFGLNCASGVNETGFTENAFWLDHERIKADTVNFVFDRKNLMNPWTVRSFDKKIDLVFRPEIQREERTNALFAATRFNQITGSYHGTLITGSGETLRISDVPGYTEDHYILW